MCACSSMGPESTEGYCQGGGRRRKQDGLGITKTLGLGGSLGLHSLARRVGGGRSEWQELVSGYQVFESLLIFNRLEYSWSHGPQLSLFRIHLYRWKVSLLVTSFSCWHLFFSTTLFSRSHPFLQQTTTGFLLNASPKLLLTYRVRTTHIYIIYAHILIGLWLRIQRCPGQTYARPFAQSKYKMINDHKCHWGKLHGTKRGPYGVERGDEGGLLRSGALVRR